MPRELMRYEQGKTLDFGDFFLTDGKISYSQRELPLEVIYGCVINDYWISLGAYSEEKAISFKREKVWNEDLLLTILTAKGISISRENSL